MKRPNEEITFVLIKPDGVRRGLSGEIMRRIEQRGLKIVALSMERPTRRKIDEHYPKDPVWIRRLGEKTLATYEKYGVDPKKAMGTTDPAKIGKSVREWLVTYMTSAPLVKMVVKGVHAVDMVRKLTGNTMPYLAEMGTVRGDFSVDSPVLANLEKRAIYNIMHASETAREARHEIRHWFTSKEIYDYTRLEDLLP